MLSSLFKKMKMKRCYICKELDDTKLLSCKSFFDTVDITDIFFHEKCVVDVQNNPEKFPTDVIEIVNWINSEREWSRHVRESAIREAKGINRYGYKK